MEHKMKKILVCGAGGFIGYHLVKVLKNLGQISTSDNYNTAKVSILKFKKYLKISQVTVDL
jgi:nucleoside-diphosphate-sugar epimerase